MALPPRPPRTMGEGTVRARVSERDFSKPMGQKPGGFRPGAPRKRADAENPDLVMFMLLAPKKGEEDKEQRVLGIRVDSIGLILPADPAEGTAKSLITYRGQGGAKTIPVDHDPDEIWEWVFKTYPLLRTAYEAAKALSKNKLSRRMVGKLLKKPTSKED